MPVPVAADSAAVSSLPVAESVFAASDRENPPANQSLSQFLAGTCVDALYSGAGNSHLGGALLLR